MNTKSFINGKWVEGSGETFSKKNPSTGQIITTLTSADSEQVYQAVQAARKAFPKWSELSVESRIHFLEKFAALVEENHDELSESISLEIGKPHWESDTEVKAMIGKIPISIDAFHKRCGDFTGGPSVTRFRPHGIVAVPGPFNFPGHLPNGHITPALLAGNTVVFKPSELAPLTGAKMIELWEQAGLPEGVINLVQGARETGEALTSHSEIDGVFFTGSSHVGQILRKQFTERPGKILALEMGGNNPLVVEQVENIEAAVWITIQSAYLTAGQRCTCARRLIIPEGKWGNEFIDELAKAIDRIVVGGPDHEPEPFMGPVVSEQVVQQLTDNISGETIRTPEVIVSGTGLVSPGLVDVSSDKNRSDTEIFGPLLQVVRVKDFDSAILEANNTEYGLAAGLVSDSRENWEKFRTKIRAGVMNWNQQLTGASSAAPFGGIGRSGNFRPGAYFAADYCSWPTASMEIEKLEAPGELPRGISR